MTSLPKNIAKLVGIVAFCGAMLVGLLCDGPPLCALKRAALGAAVAAGLTWLCAHVALGVLVTGARHQAGEEGE